MEQRDDTDGHDASTDATGPVIENRPDYARADLERPDRMARVGEAPEPDFATKDIDPAGPDPMPPGTPNFATKDIDPSEPDPIPPGTPNYATKDENLD